MKPLNVLVISYSFPPVGGVGVLRVASLARYLPTENIRLDVLTTRNPAAVGTDQSLLQDIPSSVTVHRTLTFDLPFSWKKAIKRLVTRGHRAPAVTLSTTKAPTRPGLLKRVLEYVLVPDPQVTWYPVLRWKVPALIRKRGIDLVLITVPSFSNLLLVPHLRKLFPQLPIVLDFRDEWIASSFERDTFSFSKSERAYTIARKTEAEAVAGATGVVAVTEAARRLIRSRYPAENEDKFRLIPNGFDVTRLTRKAPLGHPLRGDRITITYIGTIYPTTAPTTLVDAIQGLPPGVRSRLRLRFIGHIEEPRFRESLLQLGDAVELVGYLPQREALAAMNETDYVLSLSHDPLNVGSKFYDYIGAGKPILAMIDPAGETRRLLEELRAGWWAGVSDVQGIRTLLTQAVLPSGELLRDFRPDSAKIAQYERAVLARRYADLLQDFAHADAPGNAAHPELVAE